MSSVNGKVTLITGGANGIGAEVACRLHEKGAKLVLTDLDEALLKEVAARLGEDSVLTVVADVRDLAAMQAAVAKGIERFGGIDIVMANAGIGPFGSVLEIDPEAFKTCVDVNLMGRVLHRAGRLAVGDRAPRLRARGVVACGVCGRSRHGVIRRLEGRHGALRECTAAGARSPRSGRGVRAHVVDRHTAGQGEQGVGDLRGDDLETAWAAEENHVIGDVR
jgi:NAD(P)-dependent dehydrogenase (short-subunit alcohol dehydrogenase family)